MPAIVAERLPELTKQIGQLSVKSKDEREKILKDNEKYIEKAKKGEYDSENDEDD